MHWNTYRLCSAKTVRCCGVVLVGILLGVAAVDADAQDVEERTVGETKREARFDAFAESMRNVRLKGHFTVVSQGKTRTAQEEEYTIKSVKKLPKGDQWLFQARIRYGRVDMTVPLVLNVKWAGATPVIALDSLTIPGLGTFSARVLFHGKRYVGTWQHDDKGGHLYGVLEKIKPEREEASQEE